jgi:hypothetical protein
MPMGIEEQDQIHGRLMRERDEHKRHLAALDAEIRRTAASLRSIAVALDNRCEAATKDQSERLPEPSISLDAERYVNMEIVNRLLSEQKQAFDLYLSALRGLSRFGG